MELEASHVIAGIAILISGVSLLKSGSKEQTDTDKRQDSRISHTEGELMALQAYQKGLSDRLSKTEGQIEGFDNKIYREIAKIEKKIDALPDLIIRIYREMQSTIPK